MARGLASLIRNGEETRENHRDPTLRTRYFRKSKQDLMGIIQQLLKHKLNGWNIEHIEPEHGEIIVVRRGAGGVLDIVITVFAITPLRSAVDVSASRRGRIGDLGTTYRSIIQFFEALGREVPAEK